MSMKLPVGDGDGEGPDGNLGYIVYEGEDQHYPEGNHQANAGYIGYQVLGYDNHLGATARRQAIVNELVARDIRRPIGPL